MMMFPSEESLASIAHLCNNSIFSTHILPLVSSLAEHGNTLWQTEQIIFPSVRVVETNMLKKQRQHTKVYYTITHNSYY